ncbi:MAG: hypothetical protein EAX91_03595 [Candidatus Lokiarchaeota archaeon]|nr:hypothetical protein [Candidatus Lokiarchaeota archaeon]
MCFCGNVVELVEQHKILNDDDFIQLNDSEIENKQMKTKPINVYIEKKIIDEFEAQPLTIVDVAVGDIDGKKVGMLFIKKNLDVYGL